MIPLKSRTKGTRVSVRLPDAAWCRRRSVFPCPCPDGVVRTVSFPNWRRVKWGSPGTEPLLKLAIDHAWQTTRQFDSFDVDRLFADKLERNLEIHGFFGGDYKGRNDNFERPSSLFERLPCKRVTRWAHGEISGYFNGQAGL